MYQCVKQIRDDGYCVVPGVYDAAAIRKALDLVRGLAAQCKEVPKEKLPPLARESPILWNLHCKHPYFLEFLFSSNEIEKILMQLLNDPWYKRIPADQPNYILRQYVARSSVDPLSLHIDSFIPYTGDAVISMQCLIVLENMTAENGASVIIPGSHQSGEYVERTALKDAIPVEARAGDVVLWDSRIWHGAGANRSGRTRWTATATFTRWWIKQAFEFTRSLPQEIYERLTPKQKSILGFCSIPYNNEIEGIDMRRGYDSLHENVSDYWAVSHARPGQGDCA